MSYSFWEKARSLVRTAVWSQPSSPNLPTPEDTVPSPDKAEDGLNIQIASVSNHVEDFLPRRSPGPAGCLFEPYLTID